MLKAILPNRDNLEVDTTAARVVAQYLHELRSITLIRLLVPLFIASQQHRGASIALFEGNSAFKDRVDALQNEIRNRFITLETINKEFSETLTISETRQLRHEWETIRDWYGGTALENFRLHSHFTEQLMKLIWTLTERASRFNARYDQMDNSEDNTDLLIWFLLHETPELIELIAKIRGLATHATALGYCDEEHSSWLRYLLVQLNQKKEVFREHLSALQNYALKDVPAIIHLHIEDIKIVQLVQQVNENVLNQSTIKITGSDLFDMATAIIDSYSDVFEQGLSFVRSRINRQLDDWHLEY